MHYKNIYVFLRGHFWKRKMSSTDVLHDQLTLSNVMESVLYLAQQPLTLVDHLFQFQGCVLIFFFQSSQAGNLNGMEYYFLFFF